MLYSTINLPAAINSNANVGSQYALAICFGENVTDKYYSKMEKHAKHEDRVIKWQNIGSDLGVSAVIFLLFVLSMIILFYYAFCSVNKGATDQCYHTPYSILMGHDNMSSLQLWKYTYINIH